MSRTIILTVVALVICSLAVAEARRRESSRGCNISYQTDPACTADNSYPSPRSFGRRQYLITTDGQGRTCRCVDPNYKRCSDERRNCVETTTRTPGST